MSYFKDRNNLRSEYSGYNDLSPELRARLYHIVDKYTYWGQLGLGQEHSWVRGSDLDNICMVELGRKDPLGYMKSGTFDDTFTVLELFYHIVDKVAYEQRRTIEITIKRSFEASGSVYDFEDGQVVLRVKDSVITNIEQNLHTIDKDIQPEFEGVLGDFLTRKKDAKTTVNNAWILAERILKNLTNKGKYDEAIKTLMSDSVINIHQKKSIDQLYAYRGDANNVVHDGNTTEPDEPDAIWFIQTLLAQLSFITTKSIDKKQK